MLISTNNYYHVLFTKTPPKHIHDHYRWTRVCWGGHNQQYVLRLAGIVENDGDCMCIVSNISEQDMILLKLSNILCRPAEKHVIPYHILNFLDGTE